MVYELISYFAFQFRTAKAIRSNDGDKTVASGIVPATETASNSGTANWIGCDITLKQ